MMGRTVIIFDDPPVSDGPPSLHHHSDTAWAPWQQGQPIARAAS